MQYIGDVLPLSRIDLKKYVSSHEDHLTVTAEKLRGELAALSAYVNKAEKTLRDQIQLKVAADMKLLADLEKHKEFEIQVWQMEALPINLHVCKC